MLTDSEQIDRLRRLVETHGYGALLIIHQPGYLPCATSLVPWLSDYQIMLSLDGEHFDVWLSDDVVLTQQTADQIRQWLLDRTPAWLYDKSVPTEEQRALVTKWMDRAYDRHRS